MAQGWGMVMGKQLGWVMGKQLGWVMEKQLGLVLAKERRKHDGICAPQLSWPHVACALQPWLLRVSYAPRPWLPPSSSALLLSASGGS